MVKGMNEKYQTSSNVGVSIGGDTRTNWSSKLSTTNNFEKTSDLVSFESIIAEDCDGLRGFLSGLIITGGVIPTLLNDDTILGCFELYSSIKLLIFNV